MKFQNKTGHLLPIRPTEFYSDWFKIFRECFRHVLLLLLINRFFWKFPNPAISRELGIWNKRIGEKMPIKCITFLNTRDNMQRRSCRDRIQINVQFWVRRLLKTKFLITFLYLHIIRNILHLGGDLTWSC